MTPRSLARGAKRFLLAYVHEGAISALGLVALGIAIDVLAHPPGPVPWAILAADAPFLWLLWLDGGRRWKRWAFLYGALHFGVGLRWLAEVHVVEVPCAALVLGPVYVLFGLAIRWAVGRGAPYLLVVPTAAVLEELLRTVWLGGMPWPARSLSLAGSPALLASAATFGAYGLSFLAALASAVFSGVPSLVRAPRERRGPLVRRLALAALAPAALAGLFTHLGNERIRGFDVRERTGASITTPPVVVVQGDVGQSLKHSDEPLDANRVFDRHLELSRRGLAALLDAGRRPFLVLWAETMVPWPFVSPALAVHDPEAWANQLTIVQRVRAIDDSPQAPRWLLGAIHRFVRPGEAYAEESVGEHDSLFFLDPGLVPRPPASPEVPPPPPTPDPTEPNAPWFLARHDKVVLVPGGEYTPLGDVLPPLRAFRDLVSVIPELDAGASDQEPFRLLAEAWDDPGGKPMEQVVRAGTVICFEIAFPARCRAWRTAEHPAQVLLNAANYGWFGQTGFRAQILAVASLRAAELGATVVMAGNTGPTAFFDPVGRRYGESFDAEGRPLRPAGAPETTHREGWAAGVLHADSEVTPYARWGDFPWLGLGLGLLGLALLRPTRGRPRAAPADGGEGPG
jgi:apolipoprotein N-acyltransferase